MALKAARFTNLLLASILTGNEAGSLVATHPALRTLPVHTQVESEQAITRRYGTIMPVLMTSTILSCLPVIGMTRDRQSASFGLSLAGMTCFAGMLGLTLRGNVPINNRTLELSPQSPPDDWPDLRARWEKLHLIRVLLDLAGWSFLCMGALSGNRD